MAKNRNLTCVFLDLQGAYNNVDLTVLCDRLHHSNVPNNIILYIWNIFHDQSVQIKFNHNTSPCRFTSRGIPQGPALSPILFSLYCKDIPYIFDYNVKSLEFADDLVINTESKSIQESELSINSSLQQLKVWALESGLDVAPSKSTVCGFSRSRKEQVVNIKYNDHTIPCKPKHKFLGITFNRHLCWKPHINELKEKCLKRLMYSDQSAATVGVLTLKFYYCCINLSFGRC